MVFVNFVTVSYIKIIINRSFAWRMCILRNWYNCIYLNPVQAKVVPDLGGLNEYLKLESNFQQIYFQV